MSKGRGKDDGDDCCGRLFNDCWVVDDDCWDRLANDDRWVDRWVDDDVLQVVVDDVLWVVDDDRWDRLLLKDEDCCDDVEVVLPMIRSMSEFFAVSSCKPRRQRSTAPPATTIPSIGNGWLSSRNRFQESDSWMDAILFHRTDTRTSFICDIITWHDTLTCSLCF